MEAAEKILAGVPAPSRRTFLRAVVVMEFIFSTAFSTSNIVKGAVATGSITDGGGHGPSYARILNNCPVIKEYCDVDISRMPVLISLCREIAAEMIIEKTANPKNYLGTPDDQRMVAAFGPMFGNVHIGAGASSSHDRVTDLTEIRWRTTLIGACGQLELNKQQAAAKELAVCKTSAISVSNATQSCTGNTNVVPAAAAVASRQGKKCSNINCPDHAHYVAATCKLLWTKCSKDCKKCEVGRGGSIHVCPNEVCKTVLTAHTA
jgi:hypothetical protein